MTAVRRRLRSLALGELVNVPLQAWIWFGLLDRSPTVPNLIGYALFAMLLVQGAAYWIVKLRALGRTLPGLSFFRAARLVNPVLLAAGLAVAVHAQAWVGVGFALFAALEQVNYFHIQLMHDTRADLHRLTTTGFRRSHLALDLAAQRHPHPGRRAAA